MARKATLKTTTSAIANNAADRAATNKVSAALKTDKVVKLAVKKTATKSATPVSDAIDRIVQDAHTTNAAVLANEKQAESLSQTYAFLAMELHAAYVDMRSNDPANQVAAWSRMVEDGTRKLTDGGKAFVNRCKLAFVGQPVSEPNKKTGSQADRAKFDDYRKLAQRVDRGVKLAIVHMLNDGTIEHWDSARGLLQMNVSAFVPAGNDKAPEDEQWGFIFPIKLAGFRHLDGSKYVIAREIPHSGGTNGKKQETFEHSFSLNQALRWFTIPAATTETGATGTSADDKGADGVRAGEFDAKTRRDVLAKTDPFEKLESAMADMKIDEAATAAMDLHYFDDKPKAMEALRFWAFFYGKITTIGRSDKKPT